LRWKNCFGTSSRWDNSWNDPPYWPILRQNARPLSWSASKSSPIDSANRLAKGHGGHGGGLRRRADTRRPTSTDELAEASKLRQGDNARAGSNVDAAAISLPTQQAEFVSSLLKRGCEDAPAGSLSAGAAEPIAGGLDESRAVARVGSDGQCLARKGPQCAEFESRNVFDSNHLGIRQDFGYFGYFGCCVYCD
jgi:hypothetical protein